MIDSKKNKDEFIRIARENIHREGLEGLLMALENSDFYIAPASTKFHESYEGGLCEHSLNVYHHLVALNESYGTNYSLESITICALFHDLCKVNCYKISVRNVKDENGQWQQVPFYAWDEKDKFGGHGSKSMYLVQYYMKLYFDEASAINGHMGVESGNVNSVMDAYRYNALAFLLHTADMASTVPALNEKLGLNCE